MKLRLLLPSLLLAILGTASAAGTNDDKCLTDLFARLNQKPKITAPVPHLYASIPTDDVIKVGNTEIRFHPLKDGTLSALIETKTSGREPYRGGVSRKVSAHRIEFISTEFDRDTAGGIPKFLQIPGVPDLVPGKGIPTQLFLNMYLMRKSGVAAGELTSGRMARVTNVRTGLELLTHPEFRQMRLGVTSTRDLNAKVAQHFLETHSGRYIQSVLTQTGHRIKPGTLKVSGAKFENVDDLSMTDDPELARLKEAAIKELSVDEPDLLDRPELLDIPAKFDVDFEIEPIR